MASNHLLVTALTSVHPYRRPGLQDRKVLHFGSLTRVQSRRCRSQPSGALQQNSFSSEAHKSLQTENPEEESDVLIKKSDISGTIFEICWSFSGTYFQMSKDQAHLKKK